MGAAVDEALRGAAASAAVEGALPVETAAIDLGSPIPLPH
jgi:hypothetical protein